MNRIRRGVVLSVLALIPVLSTAASDGTGPRSALDVIHARKSVRSFTEERVSKQDLETILKAAMAAPTAMNRQPWAFVAVSDPQDLRALARALPGNRPLGQAAAAVVVCALPAHAAGGKVEYAVLDAALAAQNLLLAVEALGLGAVWTAAYPDPERQAAVRTALSIPADVIPLNVIPIGHPAGPHQPKDKYRPENIHWERW